ncbi:hypothetical protein D3C72_1726700 [compost metagenome]
MVLDDQPAVVAGLHFGHVAGLFAQLHQGAHLVFQVVQLAAGLLVFGAMGRFHALDQLLDTVAAEHLLDAFDQLQGQHTVSIRKAPLRGLGQ